MAKAELMFDNLGGGGTPVPTWSYLNSTQYVSANVETIPESDFIIACTTGGNSNYSDAVGKGESKTFIGGAYFTSNISLSADGKTLSFTKSTASANLAIIAFKLN